jgi:hypothetical protein
MNPEYRALERRLRSPWRMTWRRLWRRLAIARRWCALQGHHSVLHQDACGLRMVCRHCGFEWPGWQLR